MKKITIDCPVFKTGLTYLIDSDYKEMEKWCRKNCLVDSDDDFEHFKDADGTTFVLDTKDGVERIVWLEKFSIKHDRIGVLVHETTHAVIRILEWKGIPFSSRDNQDETFAYLMDYFISNFIYHYKK